MSTGEREFVWIRNIISSKSIPVLATWNIRSKNLHKLGSKSQAVPGIFRGKGERRNMGLMETARCLNGCSKEPGQRGFTPLLIGLGPYTGSLEHPFKK